MLQHPINYRGTFSTGETPYTSAHTGGANFLLGDGSVRFISQNTYMGTLHSLASRDQSDIVGVF